MAILLEIEAELLKNGVAPGSDRAFAHYLDTMDFVERRHAIRDFYRNKEKLRKRYS